MDGDRFDALTRAIGHGATRRGLLRGAAGGLAWLTQSRFPARAAGQEQEAPSETGATTSAAPVCACPLGLVLCQSRCVAPEACVAPDLTAATYAGSCEAITDGQGLDCFMQGLQAGAARTQRAIKCAGGEIGDRTIDGAVAASNAAVDQDTPAPIANQAELECYVQGFQAGVQEARKAIATKGISGSVATGFDPLLIADTPPASDEVTGASSAGCPPQEQRCEANGRCVPCPAAMTLDANCRCVCPEGFSSVASQTCACPHIAACSCVCPGPPCAFPKIQDPQTCRCRCLHGCPALQEQDPATCACLCPRGQELCERTGECLSCPAGQRIDPRTCQCVCPFATCGGECCPEGYVCDASATPPACCQPRGACPAGFCGTISDRCGGQIACVCDRDQICCDTDCVDTLTDREHCGRCGNACPEGSGCQESICQCEGGVVCGGVCLKGSECCVDADCPDPGPCGSRGCFADPSGTRTCLAAFAADGARCPDGICCAGICLPGKNCCGDEHCMPPETCQDNVCACIPAVACPGGFCGPVTDSCGNRADCRCAAGQTCCGRTCVDTLTSPDNCGACGAPCAPGEACVNGACRQDDEGCPPGEQRCRGECVPCAAGWTLDPDTCECSCPTAFCAGVCCAAGQVCNRELPGQCCTPRAICANNACGESPDGCGGVFELPPCPEQVCVYSVCQEGNPCSTCAFGVASAGRPGPLCDGPGQFCCGTSCCAAGQVCANTGCCTPRGVCPAGYCGTVDNGCGGQLLCECGPGLTCCDGRCVDTNTSSTNCAGCGASCQGFPCRSGICDEREGCPAGYQLCNGECIACPAQGKLDANCRCRCPRNKTLCQGKCVDRCPANRPLNPLTCTCGCPRGTTLCPAKNTCVPCPPGRRLNARCECVCPIGQTLCQDRCVDLCSTEQPLDPVTCECRCPAGRAVCQGMCCAEGQVCRASLFEPAECCTPTNTCPPGHCGFVQDGCGGALDIGPCPDQVCQTVYCQPGHRCNACVYGEVLDGEPGPLCDGAEQACCSGACTTITTDPANCGACGTRCRAGEGCIDGTCGCSCPEFACLVREWPTDCSKDGTFWPGGVAVGPDGDVYVVESDTPSIQIFNPDGSCAGGWGPGFTGATNRYPTERSVAFGPDGLIYVVNRNQNRIEVFDKNGNPIKVMGGPGSALGKFSAPSGIAVAADGTIYVVDNNNHRIQYLEPNATEWKVMDSPTPFDYPTGIAIAPNGWFYVVEQGGSRVQYFNEKREYKGQWGAFRTPPIDFWNPRGIAVGPDGTVYVADTDNYRIQAFTPDGKPLGAWGSQATGMYPYGVAVAPDGTVVVAIPGVGIKRYCVKRSAPSTPEIGPDDARPAGTPAASPTATATATLPPAPPGTPAPAPAATATPTATATPAGPPACATGERPCADRCVPEAECPAERCCLDAATCKCTCPACGANGAFDPVTCGCACTSRDCPPNWGFDEATCTCVCAPNPCAPGSNWQFDQESCSCVCVPPAECPPNFVFNEESCACVCGMTECAPNHVWDLEACTCTCVPGECPANFVFDASLCGCVCGLGGCPPNYVFDEANCACICAAQCPPTFRFDKATCSCVCELAGCPPNLTFDPGSCACFCAPPVCPPGFVVDQASCSCFCPEVACGEGQVFDPASCGCLQSGAGAAVGESG